MDLAWNEVAAETTGAAATAAAAAVVVDTDDDFDENEDDCKSKESPQPSYPHPKIFVDALTHWKSGSKESPKPSYPQPKIFVDALKHWKSGGDETASSHKKSIQSQTPTTEGSFDFSDEFDENEARSSPRFSSRTKCVVVGLVMIVAVTGTILVAPKAAGRVSYISETNQPTPAPGRVAGTFKFIKDMKGPKSQGCSGSITRSFDEPIVADAIRVQVKSFVNWPSLRVGFTDVNGQTVVPASQTSSSSHHDYACAAINGALPSEHDCDSGWSWCAASARTGDYIDFRFDSYVFLQSITFEGRQKGDQWGYVQSMKIFAAVETPQPTLMPTMSQEQDQSLAITQAPTVTPTTIDQISDPNVYVPGHLTQMKLGVRLSNGLDIRIIANSKRRVPFNDGTVSDVVFHERPDYGATFKIPDTSKTNQGGWVYVSNSEIEKESSNGDKVSGGVGRLTFNRYGKVIGYDRILEKTDRNCGGGTTPWNTFITCEESRQSPPVGHCFQVDPFTGEMHKKSDTRTVLGGSDGGSFESFAHDLRDDMLPRFFVTEDQADGALRRFTPATIDWDNPSSMLHDEKGSLDYLFLIPSNEEGRNGTYQWTNKKSMARKSAQLYYPNAEGIDVANGILYFVSKKDEDLFILDLDRGTYERKIVREEGIDVSPDQLVRLGSDDDIMYLTEDGGAEAGIHGRDAQGRYFTILESPIYKEETTGLAFSPNKKHMYLAYQKNGIIFDVWRKDGKKFDGGSLNVKYHHQ